MHLSDFIAHMETVVRIIRILVSLLTDVPKLWETARKGWALVRPHLLDAKRALVTALREMVGEDEAREDAPSPSQNTLNAFDAVNMGLNQGYPALRHRQNAAAYYYADGPNVTVSLTGQAIMSHGGRLTCSSSLSL